MSSENIKALTNTLAIEFGIYSVQELLDAVQAAPVVDIAQFVFCLNDTNLYYNQTKKN